MAARLVLLASYAALASCFQPHAPLTRQASPRACNSARCLSSRPGLQIRMGPGAADRKLSVAVIGGGPAGLAAATNLLDVSSVGTVTVIEKAPETFDDGPGTWGIGLGPRCQSLLSNMTGQPWDVSIKDQTLPTSQGFHRGTRPIIRQGIFDALTSHPGAAGGRLNLLFGNTVSAFDPANKRLTLSSNDMSIDYDCLVLADGSHSPSVAALARPQFRTTRRAYWNCLKIMPAPQTEKFTGTYMFTGKSGAGNQTTSVWLMSLKGGKRFIIFFFPLATETGKSPAGLETPADFRRFLASLEAIRGLAPPPEFDISAYWDSLDDARLQDFLSREPRAMWTGLRKNVVDEEGGVVLIGDAGGVCLPTLGQGTCMAIQDAMNLKESFVHAEKSTSGGADAVLRSAMKHYKRNGAKERKAMVLLNIVCMAMRQKWQSLPFSGFLKKLDQWIVKRVDTPQVKLASIMRNPLVWLLSRIAMLQWRTRWGIEEGYVLSWRKRFVSGG